MMNSLLITGVVVSLFFALSANFIGGITLLHNVSAENLSSLKIMQNISDATSSVRSSLNSTQTSTSTVQGFDLGGLWASVQLFFEMPELWSGIISGLGSVFSFSTVLAVTAIMLIITTKLALRIIYFVRSGSEL